ncbi:MAG: DUF937 domain-containing protein [Leptolyngbyaceae cyanobacterium SL_7_1]|nr:DUF937 domain-containing protein [Leptolyngbyaceae cyanobacterium SL_7_1]
MGLFFDVLSSINNPNQRGSIDQLSSVTGVLQELAGNRGIDSGTMQSVLSGLGGALRPMMKQQAVGGGLDDLIGQFTGASAGLGALSSVLSPQIQAQLVRAIASKTGLPANTLEPMLSTLLPAVLGLLNMGAPAPGVGGKNPLLTAFLDSDRDQDVDLGDAFKFATRFLNPAR